MTVSEDVFPEIYAGVCAYAAGIIDGEGSIQIGKNSSGDSIHIAVGNQHKALCDWLQVTFGGSVGYRKGTQSYVWSAQRTGMVKFLRMILPYSLIKRVRILLALKYLSTYALPRTNGRVSVEQRHIRDWCRYSIRVLNNAWSANLVNRMPPMTLT